VISVPPNIATGVTTEMAARTTAGKAAPKAAAKLPTKAAASTPTRKSAAPTTESKAPAKAGAKPTAPATVTLKHLSAGLAGRHGMEKKQADAVVTDVFEILVAHLKSGDRVRIGGLGILEVKDRPARMGRNPATGEAVQIAASRKVAFRVAKDLKSTI
jgi:DNA-binding protein HU-beta